MRPLPESKIFDSLLFHDFESGVEFMRAVSKTNCWPSSLRLMDSKQFEFGAALKPAPESKWEQFVDKAKSLYVVKVKGFNPEKLAVATMLFEGDASWTQQAHKRVLGIAKQYNAMVGGAENGKRGYLMTFLITYIRDFSLNYRILSESFELSCPWTMVSELVNRMTSRIERAAASKGFGKDRLWQSYRVT